MECWRDLQTMEQDIGAAHSAKYVEKIYEGEVAALPANFYNS